MKRKASKNNARLKNVQRQGLTPFNLIGINNNCSFQKMQINEENLQLQKLFTPNSLTRIRKYQGELLYLKLIIGMNFAY